MKRSLPPLNAIVAFEAAARLGSFSKAADELHVTHGAISKQIKVLESFLNKILFERTRGGIFLTEEAAQYLSCISHTLDSLSRVTRNLKGHSNDIEPIIIDVTSTFASSWLLPRLADFHQRFKNIRVNLVTGNGLVNFSRNTAHGAVRCLPRSSITEQDHLLFPESLTCVANTDLLRDFPIECVQDITRHQLIPQINRPNLWSCFFERYNIQPTNHRFSCGFEDFNLTLQAARYRHGVCLAPDFLYDHMPFTGELTALPNLATETEFAYVWQSPQQKSGCKKVNTFFQWLTEQVQDKTGHLCCQIHEQAHARCRPQS